jgi:hypothetical protein
MSLGDPLALNYALDMPELARQAPAQDNGRFFVCNMTGVPVKVFTADRSQVRRRRPAPPCPARRHACAR